MTSQTDKLGMSLDEIIKLNKRKPGAGPGSVISRGTQQLQSRRGGKGNRNYQSNTISVSLQGRFQGRGRRFNQVSYRNQFWAHKHSRFYGQSPLMKRYGGTASSGNKVQNSTYTGSIRGYGSFRGRLRHPGQRLARNRIRLATQILNMRQQNRQQALQYWNSGSVQGGYRIISTPRSLRGLPMRQWRGFHAGQGMMNSLRSDQITRLQKQQTVQRKLNRARALKSGQFMDKNAVTGSSDLLTVCIANDLAVKIHGRKQRTNTIKKFGGNNNFIGGSFTIRCNNNSYLGHQNTAATGGASSVVDISPEGSIVTTINRYNSASSVGRNRQAGSVIRGVKHNRAPAVEHYVPVTKERSALNLQLQKEIAAIQGKTFQPSTSSMDFTPHAVGLSGFKPVPSLTATTLNERFSLAL